MPKQKGDKKAVCRYHKEIIKELHHNWNWATEIARKLWYKVEAIQKYIRSFKEIIYNWEIYYRCSICKTHKPASEFWRNSKLKNWLRWDCKYCHNLIRRNRTIIEKNMWKETTNAREGKIQWKKNGWRRNIRKRILRIIWVLDWHWRLINKRPK